MVKIYDHQAAGKEEPEIVGALAFKTILGFLKAKNTIRYQYLKDNMERYSICNACKTLGISTSGFYE